MVRPDAALPIAADIGHLLSKVHGKKNKFWRWHGFDPSNPKHRLYARSDHTDTNIHYSRKDDWEARIALFNIQQTGVRNLKFHDPIVLRSEPRMTVAADIDNVKGRTDKTQTVTKTIDTSKSELDEVKAGFELSSKTTIGTGEASSVKVEEEITVTVSSEWTKQTGRTESDSISVTDEIVALPGTRVTTFFNWEEQDLKRHVEGEMILNCGVQIGKRSDHGTSGKWHWTGSVRYDSIDELIAVAKGNGSTKADLYNYFYDRANTPPKKLIEKVDNRIAIPMDFFVEYKGAISLKTTVDTPVNKRKELGFE